MNGKLPVHIDPREINKKPVSEETKNLAEMMKQSGSSPYRYIRRAVKALGSGDFAAALDWIDLAADFEGVFYAPHSDENERFATAINMLRYTFLFLIEMFERLPAEAE